jgi:ABC-type lipoprotein export system ATPase subunit
VLELLLSLTRQAGKTLILATHSPDVVPIADRVFRIHEGHLVEAAHGDADGRWHTVTGERVSVTSHQ